MTLISKPDLYSDHVCNKMVRSGRHPIYCQRDKDHDGFCHGGRQSCVPQNDCGQRPETCKYGDLCADCTQ